jgi:hypothetical protein
LCQGTARLLPSRSSESVLPAGIGFNGASALKLASTRRCPGDRGLSDVIMGCWGNGTGPHGRFRGRRRGNEVMICCQLLITHHCSNRFTTFKCRIEDMELVNLVNCVCSLGQLLIGPGAFGPL